MLTLSEIIINIKQRLSSKIDGFESDIIDENLAKHIGCAMKFIETGAISKTQIPFFDFVLRDYVESPQKIFPNKKLTTQDKENVKLLARIAMLGEVYEVCLKHPEIVNAELIARLMSALDLQQRFLKSDFAKGELSPEVIAELKLLNEGLKKYEVDDAERKKDIKWASCSNQLMKSAIIVIAAYILFMNSYDYFVKNKEPTSFSIILNLGLLAILGSLWSITKLEDREIDNKQEIRGFIHNHFQPVRQRITDINAQRWTQENVNKLVKAMFISAEKIKQLSNSEANGSRRKFKQGRS